MTASWLPSGWSLVCGWVGQHDGAEALRLLAGSEGLGICEGIGIDAGDAAHLRGAWLVVCARAWQAERMAERRALAAGTL